MSFQKMSGNAHQALHAMNLSGYLKMKGLSKHMPSTKNFQQTLYAYEMKCA